MSVRDFSVALPFSLMLSVLGFWFFRSFAGRADPRSTKFHLTLSRGNGLLLRSDFPQATNGSIAASMPRGEPRSVLSSFLIGMAPRRLRVCISRACEEDSAAARTLSKRTVSLGSARLTDCAESDRDQPAVSAPCMGLMLKKWNGFEPSCKVHPGAGGGISSV